jgi:hypothetical protein
LRGTARERAVPLHPGDEINGKNVIYARQRHVWMNAMSSAPGEFCAVVTYEKNVTYALAGAQDSNVTLASQACGTARPALRGTGASAPPPASGLRAVIYARARHL